MPNKDGTGPMSKGPGIGAGRGKGFGNISGQGPFKPGRNNGRCGQGRGASNTGRHAAITPKSNNTTD